MDEVTIPDLSKDLRLLPCLDVIVFGGYCNLAAPKLLFKDTFTLERT